jgi:signal transduction histidine kinase
MFSDISLEIIKTIIVFMIVIYLFWYSNNNKFIKHFGFTSILIGFSLLLFASVLDITDNIEGLEVFIVIGDTPVQAFLEKVVGYILSSIFLLIGFGKLLPVLSKLKETEQQLQQHKNTLEQTVEKRTKKLQRVNQELTTTLIHLSDTQEQLIEKEKMAALGDLVAGIAHEVNTPIGICLTASSFMKERYHAIEKKYISGKMTQKQFNEFLSVIDESSSIIESNVQRAAEIIQNFKKVAVDQSTEDLRCFLFKDYLFEILKALHPKLKRFKHNIDIVCDDNQAIKSYPGAYYQIFSNLIINSLIHGFESIEQGEIQILVHFNETNKKTNSCEMSIEYRDNGKGIDATIINNIFEPFVTTRRNKGGTGLGTHILYNIVTQQLNGSIICEKSCEQGVLFKMLLPITLCPVTLD